MPCGFVLDMHMHIMQIWRMTFEQFLTDNEISLATAALHLRRDVTLIGRYRARKITPSPEVIADIVEWSGGKVTPRELLALSSEAAA